MLLMVRYKLVLGTCRLVKMNAVVFFQLSVLKLIKNVKEACFSFNYRSFSLAVLKDIVSLLCDSCYLGIASRGDVTKFPRG